MKITADQGDKKSKWEKDEYGLARSKYHKIFIDILCLMYGEETKITPDMMRKFAEKEDFFAEKIKEILDART